MSTTSGVQLRRSTVPGKVTPPIPPAGLVDRPRLRLALDSGLGGAERTFTVVSAPAGYGKTTLLAQWASAAVCDGVRVAWCALDADDRDPVVFWTSVVSALTEAVDRDDDIAALGDLRVSLAPRGHSEFVAGLSRCLDRLGPRFALVFDDTHHLEGSAAEKELIRLLRLTPDGVYIVFATRSTLLEQRARLTDRLLELSADALSFTQAEAAELFDCDDVGVERLCADAEGWPAALSLSRLAVRRGTATLDARLGGLDPDILYEYLQREVYADLDADSRAALLTLAVCPSVCADLVDAMSDGLDSALPLRRLARSNAMLRRVASADDHTWYRVQPLFRTFLRDKLAETSATSSTRMVQRAALWHIDHGDALVALQLALDASDGDLVDTVLRHSGYDLVAGGHAPGVLALTGSSTGNASGGPFATLMLAWAAVAVGEIERAEDAVARVRPTGLGVDDLFEWDWLLYLVQVRIALARGEAIDGLSSGWADSTMLELPDPVRAAVHLARGLAETRIGVTARAIEDLEASRAIAENVGDRANQLMSAVGLATTALAATDIRTTARQAEAAIDIAGRSSAHDTSVGLAYAHTLAGWARHQLLDDDLARTHVAAAAEFAARQPLAEIVTEARHAFQAVNFDTLPDKRRAAQDFATSWPHDYLLGSPVALVVSSLHFGLRMSLALGENRWSERLLDRARHLIGEGHDWHAAYALYLNCTGRQASARGILTPLLHDSRKPRTPLSEIVEWSLEAVIEHEAGNAYRAHAAMYRSLERADDTGALAEVVRPRPDSVRAILTHGAHRFGEHDALAAEIVARGRDATEAFGDAGGLTPKERQLLSELKTLRTVGEISDDMLLSINTVKTHMRGIYRKLGVTSRRSAIAEAERLGLI